MADASNHSRRTPFRFDKDTHLYCVARVAPRRDCLAGRPLEGAAGHDVQVEVVDGLARAPAVVHDEAELLVPGVARDAACGHQELPTEGGVLEIAKTRDVLLRHHEDMERRAWEDVVDGEQIVVVEDDLRRHLAVDDPAEEAVLHRAENTRVIVVLVLASYLFSSVSFPWLIARLYGVDLGAVGSRKLGGSNLVKSVGLVPGIVGGVLDGAKGFVAFLAAGALGHAVEVQLLCGVAAVVGQMWPLFHRFDGGRANATGWGFAIAADPIAALIMGIPILAALLMKRAVPSSRLVPLASILSFAVFPAVIWEQEGTTPTVVAGLAVLALVLVRRISAGLRADLATGAPFARVIANRALYDRSELQERGLVAI